MSRRTLNSGWGVRTMSERDRGFNPIGYHTGTVWPHDNSLLAAGLVRYGFRQYANRIASDMLTAARHFDYRLPEVFAGYRRGHDAVPGGLPDRLLAAGLGGRRAGAVPDLMLGLRPDAADGQAARGPDAAGGLPATWSYAASRRWGGDSTERAGRARGGDEDGSAQAREAPDTRIRGDRFTAAAGDPRRRNAPPIQSTSGPDHLRRGPARERS